MKVGGGERRLKEELRLLEFADHKSGFQRAGEGLGAAGNYKGGSRAIWAVT